MPLADPFALSTVGAGIKTDKPQTERPPTDDVQKGEVDPDTIYHPDNTI